jgi:hypothetical protein
MMGIAMAVFEGAKMRSIYIIRGVVKAFLHFILHSASLSSSHTPIPSKTKNKNRHHLHYQNLYLPFYI